MEFVLKMLDNNCTPEEFTINGITASADDFGEGFDNEDMCESDLCESDCSTCDSDIGWYGCINRVFESMPATPEVLNLYHINENEYEQIASELSSKLSLGHCDTCL